MSKGTCRQSAARGTLRTNLLLPALVLAIVLGSAAVPEAFAQTNLLVNGSFEEPRQRASVDASAVQTVAPSGWNVVQGSVSLVPYSVWEGAYYQGRQVLLLGGATSATIEQSVPTHPGAFYLVSGWLARDPTDVTLPAGTVQISLNGQSLGQAAQPGARVTEENMRWKLFVYRFQATEATTILRLAGRGAALDGLAVTVSAGNALPAPFFTVDLTGHMTNRLWDGMLDVENDLAELGEAITPETPLRMLRGVPFRLDGVVLVGPDSAGDQKLRRRAEGIAVGRKAQRLFFLHANHYSQYSRGTQMGAYTILYADTTSVTLPIRYGIETADWWSYSDSKASGAAVAWTGRNESSARWSRLYNFPASLGRPLGLQLFLFAWDNPKPDVEIQSIDLVPASRTPGSPAIPFLVGVTGAAP